ncbi:MAG: Gfo/Idh/MocA family oxidoreductase [Planctomycetaceae bacterium]|nr:Gfo/Idh/MocA family oxidoreductase [Planctomycetaceae bacterium]
MSPITRRQFLSASVAGLTLSTWPVGKLPAAVGANEKVQVGIVGLGSRGFNLLDAFLAQSNVAIVALCDVHDLHYRDRSWGQGAPMGLQPAVERVRKSGSPAPRTTSDSRELCAAGDLDAIVVATPDHWHALCTLDAIRHGKDVYCEKPVTHLFGEGQRICEAVAKHQAVFQTGSQQRSDPLFQRALALIESGVLGRIERIEVGLPPGYAEPQDSVEVADTPSGLDYDRWCGPAPKLPYMRARHHRWWRGHRAYGGGVLMDWIGHHNDIAQLSLKTQGPCEVHAVEWVFPPTDVYDTPAQYTIACRYADGVTSTISSRNSQGVKWFGETGWLYVRRGHMEASRPEILKGLPSLPKVEATVPHVRNFVDCISSRKECIAPAKAAHQSITPGHLGYLSQRLGQKLNWDPATETITNSTVADADLKSVSYRDGWDDA